ncbi:MAG: Lrp/AsnC family transcriptional regulator [Verrucomicrobiales bacterium]|nr:Lrp/AsnC family transcriptional regulator [Verrucomicrobiales bacterium]
MEALLELLKKNARFSPAEIADRLNMDEKEVVNHIKDLENNGTILGYHGVIDRERSGDTNVTAMIEIKLTPERDGGFDRLAERIAKFHQVTHCYLMSGGYDLAVMVEGETLNDVARFVSEKLSTVEGVIATSTHFQLKVYKQSGFLASAGFEDQRLAVSP